MQSDLADFIGQHEPFAQETAVWGNGRFPLEITYYFSQELPPPAYITSVRAVVLQNQKVLTVRDPEGGLFVVPGGRCEENESLVETVKREVLEETGWQINIQTILAFTHFHHLVPKPDDYPYPHPDFIHLIYLADANGYTAQAKVYDEWVADSRFMTVAEVMGQLQLTSQRLLLQAAMARRL